MKWNELPKPKPSKPIAQKISKTFRFFLSFSSFFIYTKIVVFKWHSAQVTVILSIFLIRGNAIAMGTNWINRRLMLRVGSASHRHGSRRSFYTSILDPACVVEINCLQNVSLKTHTVIKLFFRFPISFAVIFHSNSIAFSNRRQLLCRRNDCQTIWKKKKKTTCLLNLIALGGFHRVR